MKEIEIKSALSEETKRELLLEFPVTRVASQEDVYYDTPEATFFKLGVFIRKRDGRSLDIKYNSDTLDLSHTACDEYSYRINEITQDDFNDIFQFISDVSKVKKDSEKEYQDLDHLFQSLDLREFVTISKERQYLDMGENVEVVLDHIDGIGAFVEIEVNDESHVHYIEKASRKYHLQNIPIGYVELWLRKNCFELYKTGRYLLDEDRG